MKICPIFTLTGDVDNAFYGFEDIQQQTFLAKFHETLMLPGVVNSIVDSTDSLLLN